MLADIRTFFISAVVAVKNMTSLLEYLTLGTEMFLVLSSHYKMACFVQQLSTVEKKDNNK